MVLSQALVRWISTVFLFERVLFCNQLGSLFWAGSELNALYLLHPNTYIHHILSSNDEGISAVP